MHELHRRITNWYDRRRLITAFVASCAGMSMTVGLALPIVIVADLFLSTAAASEVFSYAIGALFVVSQYWFYQWLRRGLACVRSLGGMPDEQSEYTP